MKNETLEKISGKLNELIDTEDRLSLIQKKEGAIKSIMDDIVLMDGIEDTLISCKSYARINPMKCSVECRTLVMINGKEVAVENEISEYELSSGLLSVATADKIKCDIAIKIANTVFGESLSVMLHELNLEKKNKYYVDAVARHNDITKPAT